MYRIVSFGALPTLAAAEQAEVQAITKLMPDCYTQELSDCIKGRSSAYRHCQELTERYLWLPDDSPIVAHVKAHLNEKVDYCHENQLIKSPLGIGLIAGAAIVGLAIGIMIPSRS
jgi:hypothetical protein